MVIWTKQFETGSEFIDQQHRMLINNINYLECLLTSNNPIPQDFQFLIEVVDFLESYAETHFHYEENCMETHRCPVRARNKAAHAEFMLFFSRFKERCHKEGFRAEIIQELHQAMSLWIQGHILHVDTELKPCLKK